jgi:fatty-acyl-CoA synthase
LGFDHTLSVVEKYKCTRLTAMPKIIHNLLDASQEKRYDLSSLRVIGSGGQSFPTSLLKRVRREWNIENVVLSYGMTEIGFVFYENIRLNSIELELDKIQTEKYRTCLPLLEFKIVNPETGLICPLNEPGTLHIRGFSVTTGYWNDELNNSSFDQSGWFNTGDVMSMEANGVINFVGRANDIIYGVGNTNSRFDISPLQIEECIRLHECVKDVAVFGLPVNDYEQEVCAWVVLKQGQDSSLNELLEYCRDKLVDYKVPKHIKFVHNLPITRTGKYWRKEMERQFKLELELGTLP